MDRARAEIAIPVVDPNDLNIVRFSGALPPASMLPPGGSTNDSQPAKSLPVSRSRTTGSFTKQTIK